jgi:hypothetical protein
VLEVQRSDQSVLYRINRMECRSINNQRYALNYITSLFNVPAPTCFGSSLPSSGSFLDPCELLEQIGGISDNVYKIK